MENFSVKKVLKSNYIFLTIIAVFTVILYANSITGKFVSDDIPAILENPIIGSPENEFKHLAVQGIANYITFAIFGFNETAFHIRNMALHLINLCIFFVFSYFLLGKKGSLVSTILFLTHPLGTEAVSWISGSPYVFNSIFSYSILLLYFLYNKTGNKNYLLFMIPFWIIIFVNGGPFLLSIFFILVSFDLFVLKNKLNKKNITLFIILGTFAFISVLFNMFLTSEATKRIDSLKTGQSNQIHRYAYSIYSSVELMLFPKDLALLREGNVIPIEKMGFMIFISVLLICITVLLIFKKSQVGGFILMIFASMAPVYFPMQIAWFVADRYHYFAIGIYGILLAKCYLYFKGKFNPKAIDIIFSILIVIFSLKTINRNADWKTPKALWLSNLKISPNSHRIHNNLGDTFAAEGDFENSINFFTNAITLNPEYSDAAHNLGHTYLAAGNLDEAEKWLKYSLKYNPVLIQSYYKLAIVEIQRNNLENAKAYLNTAIQIDPNYSDAISLLSKIAK